MHANFLLPNVFLTVFAFKSNTNSVQILRATCWEFTAVTVLLKTFKLNWLKNKAKTKIGNTLV